MALRSKDELHRLPDGSLRAEAVYLSLHTADDHAAGWSDELLSAWPTVTHRSTWLRAEPRDVLVAVAEPITTYPRWAGGLYAAAQLRDAQYRAAVARWVANGG